MTFHTLPINQIFVQDLSHKFLTHEVFHQILSSNAHNVPKLSSCGVVEIMV